MADGDDRDDRYLRNHYFEADNCVVAILQCRCDDKLTWIRLSTPKVIEYVALFLPRATAIMVELHSAHANDHTALVASNSEQQLLPLRSRSRRDYFVKPSSAASPP
jgi:hypothetical protein